MYSFCVEEQKGLMYHLEGLRVPLVVRVPQFGSDWIKRWQIRHILLYNGTNDWNVIEQNVSAKKSDW